MKLGIRRKEKLLIIRLGNTIGNLGKTENGIVSVNAYGVVEGITYPLMFKSLNLALVFKKEINIRLSLN
jgi:SRSO17 transposase